GWEAAKRGRRPETSFSGEWLRLNRGLGGGAAVQRLAQPAAALQVAEHGFRDDLHGLGVFRPLQLLAAGRPVVEHVLEPKQVRVALAHGHTAFRSSPFLAGNVSHSAKGVPRAARTPRAPPNRPT